MYSAAELKKSKSIDKQTGNSQQITIQQNRYLVFSKNPYDIYGPRWWPQKNQTKCGSRKMDILNRSNFLTVDDWCSRHTFIQKKPSLLMSKNHNLMADILGVLNISYFKENENWFSSKIHKFSKMIILKI